MVWVKWSKWMENERVIYENTKTFKLWGLPGKSSNFTRKWNHFLHWAEKNKSLTKNKCIPFGLENCVTAFEEDDDENRLVIYTIGLF